MEYARIEGETYRALSSEADLIPEMTILTDPVPCGRFFVKEIAKAMGRPVKRILNPLPSYMQSSYRGHPAVTRSLVEGMKKLGASFNYNPKRRDEVGESVVVLSGIGALAQAIEWKRQGRIRKLLAGPNILVWPSEHPEIAAREVDVCITPCDWTCEGYELDLPALRGRCKAWPAGVDVEWWKPATETSGPRNRITFYIKYLKGPIPDAKHLIRLANDLGFETHEVIYGSYTPPDYKKKLSESMLMIGLSRDESQGIAWAEAWAMDVPTLMWGNKHNVIRGKGTRVSVAPYLTAQTGSFFEDANDLAVLLSKFQTGKISFSPRQWVLENMSDEVCAKKLLDIATSF